jgi:hypothetical protein
VYAAPAWMDPETESCFFTAEITIDDPNTDKDDPNKSPDKPLSGWIFWVRDHVDEYSNT